MTFATMPTPSAPQTNIQAITTNFNTNGVTAVMFLSPPNSVPQINTSQYYWAIVTSSGNFTVYLSQEDALTGINPIKFTSAGSSPEVLPWYLIPIFTLEQLTFDTFLDCAVYYSGNAVDTINTGALFNAQDIAMVGDGFGFTAAAETNTSNQIIFEAHGQTVDVTEAYIGFSINTIIEPMPLNIAQGNSAKQSSLTKPIHCRFVRFMFNQTIGGTINGIPIALSPFDMANIGNPPQPASGIFEIATFSGWDDFNFPTYTIEHSDPFNMILLGVFYSIETS